jgi:hypothetical protein
MEAFVKNAIYSAVIALISLVAACGDRSVAPQSQPSDESAGVGGVTTQLTQSDTVRFTITINPHRSTHFYLGAGNSLNFPAASVCDPAVSTYGPSEWDNPCVAATRTIAENVTAWLDAGGHPQVDFSPSLRFVPTMLPTGWVTLTFGDLQASLDPMYNILYCSTPDAVCVDESLTDLSLVTTRDPVTGQLTRRIKHFSGYLVGAGDDGMSISSDFNKRSHGGMLPAMVVRAKAATK